MVDAARCSYVALLVHFIPKKKAAWKETCLLYWGTAGEEQRKNKSWPFSVDAFAGKKKARKQSRVTIDLGPGYCFGRLYKVPQTLEGDRSLPRRGQGLLIRTITVVQLQLWGRVLKTRQCNLVAKFEI